MLSNSKAIRFTRVLIPVLLVSALLLGACTGQNASASAEVDTGAQSNEGSQNGDAAMAGDAEMEDSDQADAEADVGAGEDASEDSAMDTEADAGAEAEEEADAGAYPELVLGDPAFRETDPSTVSLVSGQIQFVEFFAYWCTVCRAIAPTVHGLEQIYGDRVNFVYLDRDDPATAEFQAQLGYVYQPHIFILDGDGNVLFESLSYVEGEVLQEAIEQALQ